MTHTPVTSPCIKVCAVDGESGWCLGCGRTLQEIAGWVTLGPEGRKRVETQLDGRMDWLKAAGKLGKPE